MAIHIQCAYCNEVLDDFESGAYCPICKVDHQRRMLHRSQQASVSRWAKKLRTADAQRAAQLSSALVFELGGYEEAAEAIARCFQEIAGDQKRPAQAMHMLIVILRFIIMGLPATTKRQRWARTKENKAKKREQNKRSHQARMKRKRQQQ